MKTINLYFKFTFTSLSPDAQPISLGIVSDEYKELVNKNFDLETKFVSADFKTIESKSFYAEFTDFEINRCDDWVKENVVSKLMSGDIAEGNEFDRTLTHEIDLKGQEYSHFQGPMKGIAERLKQWLEQFSDYQIQFVMDCSYLGAMHIIDLLDERESDKGIFVIPQDCIPDCMTGKEFIDELHKGRGVIVKESTPEISILKPYKRGLPILPENISPIVQDLNETIAFNKKISVREAFEVNREEMVYDWIGNNVKWNTLWDAKVIKEIFNKLK